ncbi:MAG: DNA (cytosine-5-)-methyltransferase [Sphaerochaeta sp.]|nr:DNA (cytosine-5-)-methyltransferase [Sphaerochaeta sp.]
MEFLDIFQDLISVASSLHESEEKLAILTHLIENPDIQIPFITSEEHNQITQYIKDVDFDFKNKIPYPKNDYSDFKFIDLFAGIGGFRQALQNQGGECVFSSEWDKHAAKTYFANYGVFPFGDIRNIEAQSIPDHDILCGGFPCQPFSIAGVSKKNSMGRATGFSDETQGTLFFEIARILEAKRPLFFFLENVKNIKSHDKGRTMEVIQKTFDELEYKCVMDVVDGREWVPQHRERVFFLGYDSHRISFRDGEFVIPKHPGDDYVYPTLDTIIDTTSHDRTLTDGTWKSLQRHKEKHALKKNGFGYRMLDYPITSKQVTWTISARYYKDGADCLVPQKGLNPRKLSIKEILRLQGFDDKKFIFPVGITHAYKQVGNSVVIPAIEESAKLLAGILRQRKTELGKI